MDHLHMVADKFSSVQDQTMGDLIRKLWMRIERNLIPKLGIFEEGMSTVLILILGATKLAKTRIAGFRPQRVNIEIKLQ